MGTPQRVRLPELAPEAYRHPLDEQAARALRSVPGFEVAVRKFSRYSFEKFLYHEYCASAVKVSERQCGAIHTLLREACDVLDVPQPSLFIAQTPIANAFAFGKEEPAVVLWTGLVELLDEDELRSVIAHELGHIQCGHSIYRLMSLLLELLARFGGAAAGVGELFSLSLHVALLEWWRKAEFSADRAALLVAQDPEIVFSSLFKLTGGSPKIFEQMDRNEYLRQADEYERPDAGKLDRLYKTLLETEKTHPIPVLRAREALRWGASDEYSAILSGEYVRRAPQALGGRKESALPLAPRLCPACGGESDAGFTFCTHCGTTLTGPKREGGDDA
jgi:Zn-dependent protease with chaperone function